MLSSLVSFYTYSDIIYVHVTIARVHNHLLKQESNKDDKDQESIQSSQKLIVRTCWLCVVHNTAMSKKPDILVYTLTQNENFTQYLKVYILMIN